MCWHDGTITDLPRNLRLASAFLLFHGGNHGFVVLYADKYCHRSYIVAYPHIRHNFDQFIGGTLSSVILLDVLLRVSVHSAWFHGSLWYCKSHLYEDSHITRTLRAGSQYVVNVKFSWGSFFFYASPTSFLGALCSTLKSTATPSYHGPSLPLWPWYSSSLCSRPVPLGF